MTPTEMIDAKIAELKKELKASRGDYYGEDAMSITDMLEWLDELSAVVKPTPTTQPPVDPSP